MFLFTRLPIKPSGCVYFSAVAFLLVYCFCSAVSFLFPLFPSLVYWGHYRQERNRVNVKLLEKMYRKNTNISEINPKMFVFYSQFSTLPEICSFLFLLVVS